MICDLDSWLWRVPELVARRIFAAAQTHGVLSVFFVRGRVSIRKRESVADDISTWVCTVSAATSEAMILRLLLENLGDPPKPDVDNNDKGREPGDVHNGNGRRVIEALRDGAKHSGQIALVTGLPSNKVRAAVSLLYMMGVLAKDGEGYVSKGRRRCIVYKLREAA